MTSQVLFLLMSQSWQNKIHSFENLKRGKATSPFFISFTNLQLQGKTVRLNKLRSYPEKVPLKGIKSYTGRYNTVYYEIIAVSIKGFR